MVNRIMNGLIAVVFMALAAAMPAAAVPGPGNIPVYGNPIGAFGVSVATIVILIIAIYFIIQFDSQAVKMIVIGLGLAPIGMLIWLYGDYGGGAGYVWGGFIILLVAILTWVFGDITGGVFANGIAKHMKRARRRRRR